MNFEEIRDAIYGTLLEIDGIGKVFRHRRYTNDIEGLISLYVVPLPENPEKSVPCVVWIDRVSAPENAISDEAETTVVVERTETWRIELYHGLYDDENEDQASVTRFQRLADKIQSAFRFNDDLGIPQIVRGSGPLTMDLADRYTQDLSGFTCHMAIFSLRVQQLLTT